jgi:hypothetical protein
MLHATRVLAASAVELFEDQTTRAAIRAEFDRKAKGATYRLLIPDGLPASPGP